MYKDMLSTMGIDMRDSSGWLKTEKVRGGGQCGTLAMKYQHVRHHGSDDFFSRMSSRLAGSLTKNVQKKLKSVACASHLAASLIGHLCNKN
jgi:hypothetical protein